MKPKTVGASAAVIITLLTAAVSTKAYAALGGGVETIDSDNTALCGKKHTSQDKGLYSIHEISMDGMAVREFISKSGVVFGVAWKGNNPPDLNSLLGPYLKDYSGALQNTQPRRTRGSRAIIRGSSVVVEKAGHLRSMQGRAYVSKLIPTGVNSDEIK